MATCSFKKAMIYQVQTPLCNNTDPSQRSTDQTLMYIRCYRYLLVYITSASCLFHLYPTRKWYNQCQALIRRVDQLPVYLLLLFLQFVFCVVARQLWQPIAHAAFKESLTVIFNVSHFVTVITIHSR